ncbi:MAG: hypothetical protein JWM16_4792, partial [Verrucomicrobiales bacterium]|nr:hypothetical protein [Verrucomicrobiales bacterium]
MHTFYSMQRWLTFAPVGFVVCCLATACRLYALPQAFEVGPFEADELPKGKFAEGIIGDFILRNDKVEAVVSGNFSNRRANFKTFRGTNGVNSGDLYDLTLRGTDNDQLTIFAPDHQVGPVSWVRIVKPGTDGEAVIETVVTASKNKGIYKRHEYRIKDGWPGVLITTTVKNERNHTYFSWTDDVWTSFGRSGVLGGIAWGDAVDPADKTAYAYGYTESTPNITSPTSFSLNAGTTATWSRFLAVGNSPADALSKVTAFRVEPVGTFTGTIKDRAGVPVTTAQIMLRPENTYYKECIGYTDEKGRFSFQLPPGVYEIELTDQGRQSISNKIALKAKGSTTFSPVMTVASAIVFNIHDEGGRSLPCKAQFLGTNGTPSVDLGPISRAHGCKDQYHSEKGQFRVALPAGTYKVIVTRGPEYSHLESLVKVDPETTAQFEGTLKRLVDTTGWVSADYHNHSIPSGDTSTSTDDRIINLAAEHIEFAPATEHNRICSWRPSIEKLGLKDFIQTIAGLELTGSGPHLNSFPLKPIPHTQDSGAPEWDKDPRLDALTLRDWQKLEPDRWVQLNHPDMVESFIDRNDDGKIDGGYV